MIAATSDSDNVRQIILDTETTGFYPEAGDRVIEIGCIEFINRRVTQNTFHIYINPEGKLVGDSVEVHGITDEYLIDKPTFAEVAESFLAWVGDSEIIAHNAPFDIRFLDAELAKSGSDYQIAERNRVIDTLVMAKEKHPGQRNSLDALCSRYKVDSSNRVLHGALIDADLLAKVYLGLTGGQYSLLESSNQKSVSAAEGESLRQYELGIDSPKLQQIITKIPKVAISADLLEKHQKYIQGMAEKNW